MPSAPDWLAIEQVCHALGVDLPPKTREVVIRKRVGEPVSIRFECVSTPTRIVNGNEIATHVIEYELVEKHSPVCDHAAGGFQFEGDIVCRSCRASLDVEPKPKKS